MTRGRAVALELWIQQLQLVVGADPAEWDHVWEEPALEEWIRRQAAQYGAGTAGGAEMYGHLLDRAGDGDQDAIECLRSIAGLPERRTPEGQWTPPLPRDYVSMRR